MPQQSKLPDRIKQCQALLKPEGTGVKELCDATGMTPTRVGIVMTAAAAEGAVVHVKAGRNAFYFPTLADARAFEERFAAEYEERQREIRRRSNRVHQERHGRQRAAKRTEQRRLARLAAGNEKALARSMRAAEKEIAKARARQEREAAAALKHRERIAAKTQQQRLKAETKAAGALGKQKGTASPTVAPVRGPAMLPGELDLSRAKITIAPTPPGRWASTDAPSVVSSRESRKWTEAVAA